MNYFDPESEARKDADETAESQPAPFAAPPATAATASRQQVPAGWRAAFIFLMLVIVVQFAYIIAQTNKKQTVIWHGAASNTAVPAAFDQTPKNGGTPFSYEAPTDVYWVADLAEKALPFVVSIRTETFTKEEREQLNGGGGNDNQSGGELFNQLPNEGGQSGENQLDEFFKFFERRGMQMDPEQFRRFHDFDMPPMQGQGSGFIISEDGYIVTNAHVVANFDKFLIQTNDGTEYKGTLVGRDDLKDVAVIKIEAKGLKFAVLGDSEKVRPGEPAIAIGSPFGLRETVTSGIVSTVGRSPGDVGMIDDPRSNRELIQTDAAIHPGNSGGPLLNARGEVIGINQAIIAQANRIGFAIPINSVKRSIESIIKDGDVKYPGLGIQIQTIDEQLAEQYKLQVKEGVIVKEVTKGMPGDNAGLQAGDIIVEMDGKKIVTNVELIEEIQKHDVGDKITLVVFPRGNPPAKQVLIVLGALDFKDEVPWNR